MSTPSRLYKYMPFSAQSIENLKNQVIYFGSPLQFNDPYDCALSPRIKAPTEEDVERLRAHYVALAPTEKFRNEVAVASPSVLRELILREGKQVIELETKRLVTERGVSCFAETPDNLLMWSHYADSHRGFCLEFRTDRAPFDKVRKVKYSANMPEYDLVRAVCDEDYEQVLDLYCTKGTDWQYEREWRCIHGKGGTAFAYEAEALTGIYFGARASFTSFEIAALILAGQNEHVQLWQGKRSQSEFAVAFDAVTYTPYLEAKRTGRL